MPAPPGSCSAQRRGVEHGGSKLVPTDEVIASKDHGSFFGRSVALWGDGTTALIGGWGDSGYAGAA